jgi:hypothetical protein
MPWVCTSRALPWVTPVSRASSPALPAPSLHRGIGHRFRHHVVRSWGVSHGAAVTAWGALTTCVWLGAPVAAGGAGWLYWPAGWGNGLQGSTQPLSGAAGEVVAVPEVSGLWVLLVAVAAVVLLRAVRRVMVHM